MYADKMEVSTKTRLSHGGPRYTDVSELKKLPRQEHVKRVGFMLHRSNMDIIGYYVKELKLTNTDKAALRKDVMGRIGHDMRSAERKPDKYMDVIKAIEIFGLDDRTVGALAPALRPAADELRNKGRGGEAEIVENCLRDHGIEV